MQWKIQRIMLLQLFKPNTWGDALTERSVSDQDVAVEIPLGGKYVLRQDSPIEESSRTEIPIWPVDWKSVDVTSPAGLEQLFRGLEIEWSRRVPVYTPEDDETQSPCISSTELQDLWNSDNRSGTYKAGDSPSPFQIRSTAQRGNGNPTLEEYLFESRRSVNFEVYVFPRSQQARSGTPSSPSHTITVWEDLETRQSNLQSKIKILQRQSIVPYHPVLVVNMEALAKVCSEMGNYKKAETLFRKIVSATLQAAGVQPLEKPRACGNVVFDFAKSRPISKGRNVGICL
jgi:hypothetical protein